MTTLLPTIPVDMLPSCRGLRGHHGSVCLLVERAPLHPQQWTHVVRLQRHRKARQPGSLTRLICAIRSCRGSLGRQPFHMDFLRSEPYGLAPLRCDLSFRHAQFLLQPQSLFHDGHLFHHWNNHDVPFIANRAGSESHRLTGTRSI
jgi:hypothetical protein